uniref:Polycystic kidney disease 2-like 1 protein n=1 Tax=Petromyzon marinus TaxID=7757 RepID=A0AAJ7SW14_PETMA|nr:polycystic kidney disease 2-like 1 protein [Petromyzon marinus]XP_032805653.1 polycystic kidney disease 2-like 1 protein [Petromyzon marinus]
MQHGDKGQRLGSTAIDDALSDGKPTEGGSACSASRSTAESRGAPDAGDYPKGKPLPGSYVDSSSAVYEEIPEDGPHKAEEDQSGGPKKSRKSVLRGLWGTRLTEDITDRDKYVKTTLRELFVYIAFLINLIILTFGMTSDLMYKYTLAMDNLFLQNTVSPNDSVNFNSIFTFDDFWKVVQGPVLNGLYWEKWYNDIPLVENQSFIYYENFLLGVPRIRQLKVRNDSCTVHADFQKDVQGCYAAYSEDAEDKASFGPATGTPWKYSTSSDMNGSSHWGLLATYSGGGYYLDLTRSKSESAILLQDLFDKQWLDRGTRAILIDFSSYNGNINLFSVIRLLVEFPPTGGAVPSSQIYTVKLIRYVTGSDYFILACEAIFCCFILYYIVEEILELSIHKFAYFKSVWNCLDLLVIMLSVVAIIFNVYRTVTVNKLLKALLDEPNRYGNFQFLAFWQTQYNNMVAVNVFFCWIKFFKYVSFNKTMTQLSSTLARCAKDVLGFAVMFFIIFFAYAQLGYLLFGTQVEDFSTFSNCIFTQFRIILGDFDFNAIENANRVLGPLYFTTYVFVVFFVLLNMFLAIINDTYAEVKNELAEKENEFDVGGYFKKVYLDIRKKLGKNRGNIVDMISVLDASSQKINYDDWRLKLKRLGHSDEEIEAAFAKFDKDKNSVLDSNEMKLMRDELKSQKANKQVEMTDEEKDSVDVSTHEFKGLVQNVDNLEQSISTMFSKVDVIMNKVGSLAKNSPKAPKNVYQNAPGNG